MRKKKQVTTQVNTKALIEFGKRLLKAEQMLPSISELERLTGIQRQYFYEEEKHDK